MVELREITKDNYYTLWRLMIDEKYQGRGYGKQALNMGVKFLVENFKVKEIFTSVVQENINAKELYKIVGFKETSEISSNEIVMLHQM
ncbi:MAG: GNAT family N-acetyltransferase [Clostridia bacterium]|jgi:diamine N-acetyltransferase